MSIGRFHIPGICDNQMTDSGAKANCSEVMRASTLGLHLFPGRCAQTVGGFPLCRQVVRVAGWRCGTARENHDCSPEHPGRMA